MFISRNIVQYKVLLLLAGFIILNLTLTLVHSQETIYIRPAENATCSRANTTTTASCFSLSGYVQVFKDLSVMQPTTITFLPGDHYLNETWMIQNLNVQFVLRGQSSARVHLDMLNFLVIEDTSNIEMHMLEFVLNTNSLLASRTTAVVKIVNSNVQLSNATFLQVGDKTGTFTAVQCQSSTVNINDITFIGNFRALTASSSSIVTLTGRNIFEGNVAEKGGAIYSLDSRITLLGMNMFMDNAVVQLESDGNDNRSPVAGGAIYCDNSTLKINSSTEFVNNTAESSGGAMAVYNSVLDVQGSVSFLRNSAQFNGGACFIHNTIATFGAYTSFDGNSVTSAGRIISTQFNLDHISTNGGAIYSNYSIIHLIETSFTNQVSSGSGGALFISSGTITIQDVSNPQLHNI